MLLVVISPRSSFLTSPSIWAYHAAFFHGVSGRGGNWFPHDTPGVDWETPDAEPLLIQYNRFELREFTWPGSWPVVSERIAAQLRDLPYTCLQRASTDKVIDHAWHVGQLIEVDRYDYSRFELFTKFPGVNPSTELPRFEFRTAFVKRLASSFVLDKTITIALGNNPKPEPCSFNYSNRLLDSAPVLRVMGSLVLQRRVFDKIENAVDEPFFNIREYVV